MVSSASGEEVGKTHVPRETVPQAPKSENPRQQGANEGLLSERETGVEPATFCMASRNGGLGYVTLVAIIELLRPFVTKIGNGFPHKWGTSGERSGPGTGGLTGAENLPGDSRSLRNSRSGRGSMADRAALPVSYLFGSVSL